MGAIFGILLLLGFVCNSIFSGFTFVNIACLAISLLVLLFGLFFSGRRVVKAIPNIAVYLVAIALMALITVIVPPDSQYAFTSQINKSVRQIDDKDYKSAQKTLQKLLAQEPANALVNQNLAATYLMAQDPDNALKYLTAAYGKLYSNETVLFNFGLAYYQKGNYAEALKHFEAAISLNPSMVNAHVYAGTMCYKLRNLRKAVYHLENARFLNPGMPNALYVLGMSNMGLFEYALAESNFNEALKLKPSAELKTSINEQLKYLDSVTGGLTK